MPYERLPETNYPQSTLRIIDALIVEMEIVNQRLDAIEDHLSRSGYEPTDRPSETKFSGHLRGLKAIRGEQ